MLCVQGDTSAFGLQIFKFLKVPEQLLFRNVPVPEHQLFPKFRKVPVPEPCIFQSSCSGTLTFFKIPELLATCFLGNFEISARGPKIPRKCHLKWEHNSWKKFLKVPEQFRNFSELSSGSGTRPQAQVPKSSCSGT